MSQAVDHTTPGFWGRRINVVCLLALAWAVVIDALTRIGLGGQSLSGLATLATFMACILLLPTIIPSLVRRAAAPSRGAAFDRVPISLLLFFVIAVIRAAMSPTVTGLQNVSVYGAFIIVIVLVADSAEAGRAAKDEELDPALVDSDRRWLRRAFPVVALVSTLVFILERTAGLEFIGDRSYALSAVVFTAVTATRREPLSKWLPLLVLAATVMSLSRTASAICLVLMAFTVVRGPKRGRLRRVLAFTVAAAVGATVLFLTYAPFRERFTSGDNAVTVGGTSLNTSGRSQLWAMSWRSAWEAPLFGKGPGSASELIEANFVNIGHPHNEYLRIFHDFGALGAVLWIAALITLLVTLWRRARVTDAPEAWSGLAVLLGIMMASLTDNIIIYPFVMIPAGAVIGLALVARPSTDEPPRRAVDPTDRRLRLP